VNNPKSAQSAQIKRLKKTYHFWGGGSFVIASAWLLGGGSRQKFGNGV